MGGPVPRAATVSKLRGRLWLEATPPPPGSASGASRPCGAPRPLEQGDLSCNCACRPTGQERGQTSRSCAGAACLLAHGGHPSGRALATQPGHGVGSGAFAVFNPGAWTPTP